MKYHWTYRSDSCGYMLYCNGIPQGGARTNGTATHTADGRIRHWRHRRADAKANSETGARECLRNNVDQKPGKGAV